MPRGTIDASGAFVIRGVMPGRYTLDVSRAFVEIMMPGWTLKSVTLAGRDITDRVVTVASADMSDVVVSLTDQPASLTGTVRDAKGALDANASVFAFPTDRALWPDARALARASVGGTRPWVFNTVRVSKSGGFTIGNLIPGEYFVVAAPDAVADQWPDERVLAKFSAVATRVRVEAASSQAVALRTAEVR